MRVAISIYTASSDPDIIRTKTLLAVDSLNCLLTKTRYTHPDDSTVVQSSELLLPRMVLDMFVNGENVS